MKIQGINSGMITPLQNTKTPVEGSGKIDFKDALFEALDKVNDAEMKTQEIDKLLAAGEIDNIADVRVESMKAELTLSLAIEVREKLVEAYQQIMRMQF